MTTSLSRDELSGRLAETLRVNHVTGSELAPGPSLLELEIEPLQPAWWRLRSRALRRRRREAIAQQELLSGLISWQTYRRVTPWLWEAPDYDAVW